MKTNWTCLAITERRGGRPHISPKEGIPMSRHSASSSHTSPRPLICHHWLPNTSRWQACAEGYMQDVALTLRKLPRSPSLQLVLGLIWLFCTAWANSARAALHPHMFATVSTGSNHELAFER